MPVEWRPEARAELRKILTYIGGLNSRAAIEVFQSIEIATSALFEHPYLYRPGRVPGTREIVVHPNYLVIYQITEQIEVVSVVHARQEYPST